MNFGERLDFAQKARGLSQRQLASILETQPESLQRYKKGIRKPKPNIVISIAEALNLSSFLFDESNYGYIKLDTQGDLLALIIDQIKKGILTIDGKRVLWLGDDDSVVYEGADMVLLNKWYKLWSAGKTDEADRLQIQIAINIGGAL